MSPVRADMGAAAEFERIGRRRPAPMPLPARVPIETTRTSSPYFSPKSARAPSARASSGVMMRVSTGRVLADVGVDLGLDRRELVGGHRLGMGEVEAQPVGRDEAAALGDVIAERPAQRLVQQMRGRMVGADRAAAVVVDRQLRRGAARELALLDPAVVDEDAGLLADVGDARRGRRR